MPPQPRASLVDTNVLLRHLLADDPQQSPRSTALLKRVEESKERVEIAEGVLVEAAWVLEKKYSIPRSDIARELTRILSFDGVRAPGGKRPLIEALIYFARTRCDIVDCILAARAPAVRSKVYTYDNDFKRLPCISEEPR